MQCINILFSFWKIVSHKRICVIDSSTEGFHPLNKDWVFLVIDIFPERTYFFLIFFSRNFSSALECRFHFEIYFAEENPSDWHFHRSILLLLYPSAEGIFLYFKMCSSGMEIYFTRTLKLQMKDKKRIYYSLVQLQRFDK